MAPKNAATLAAAGAAVLLAGSGCGILPSSGGSDQPALDPAAAVEQAVSDATGADTYTATLAVTGSVEGESLDTLSDIEYTADPEPTVKMTTQAQGGETAMLMRGSETVMQDPATEEWLRLDLAEMGLDSSQDPLSEVEKLLAAEGVEEAGEEEVSGEATTHYTGSFTAEEAAAEIGDEEMAEMARETYAQLGVESVDFDIWVDGDGLPRKVTHSAGDAVTTVLEFEEFNEPVEISYPSDDEITDFDQMMEDMGV